MVNRFSDSCQPPEHVKYDPWRGFAPNNEFNRSRTRQCLRKIGKSVCSPSHAWIDLHRYQRLAQAALRQDLQDGAFSIHAVSDQHIVNAYHLIEQLANLPLRTLDA